MRQGLGNPKIAQLDLVEAIEKDVFALDVAVDDLAIVDVLDRQRDLNQVIDHHLLCDELPAPVLNHARQVAAVRVFHDDVQRLFRRSTVDTYPKNKERWGFAPSFVTRRKIWFSSANQL